MEIERDIVKLSSCNHYLIIQSFKTLINLINLGTNKQQQINFRESTVSQLDVFKDQLLVATADGKIHIQLAHSFTQYKVHSSQILDVLVREGVLLSLGADGLLKQTNLRTLSTLYERQFSSRLSTGKLVLVQKNVLIQYDMKVALLNLDNDSVIQKFEINQQGPLQLRVNNLSKLYFGVLGQEGTLKLYHVEHKEPMSTLLLNNSNNFELYHNKKKTTVLSYTNEKITCFKHAGELRVEYEVSLKNIFGVFQCQNQLIVVYDHITNPKIKRISNFEDQKFLKQQLEKELKQIDEESKEVTQSHVVTYADYFYAKQKTVEAKRPATVEVEAGDAMMTNVLKQAVIANDKQIIEYAIEKTEAQLVEASINALPLEQIGQLSDYLIDRLISYPQDTGRYLPWVSAVVKRGVGNFEKLYYFIQERTSSYEKVKSILNKGVYYKLAQQKKVCRKDYRKQAHMVYNEVDQQEEVKVYTKEKKQTGVEPETEKAEEEGVEAEEDEFDQVYRQHKKSLRHQIQVEEEGEAGDNQ